MLNIVQYYIRVERLYSFFSTLPWDSTITDKMLDNSEIEIAKLAQLLHKVPPPLPETLHTPESIVY